MDIDMFLEKHPELDGGMNIIHQHLAPDGRALEVTVELDEARAEQIRRGAVGGYSYQADGIDVAAGYPAAPKPAPPQPRCPSWMPTTSRRPWREPDPDLRCRATAPHERHFTYVDGVRITWA